MAQNVRAKLNEFYSDRKLSVSHFGVLTTEAMKVLLQGYEATSIGKQLTVFRRGLMPPSSENKNCSLFLWILKTEAASLYYIFLLLFYVFLLLLCYVFFC
jgi:hypothetical protein